MPIFPEAVRLLSSPLISRLHAQYFHEAMQVVKILRRAVARTLIGGGGCMFIYSGSARLASFEINFISKETSRAEPEYMNIHPPLQLTL